DVIPLPVIAQQKPLWRSLEERESPESVLAAAEREFPMGAADFSDGIARRSFIQLLGSSVALAGLGACAYRPPDEKILPYTVKPEGVTPSLPLHFATASGLGGRASGLLVQSYEGRPTKVEGNPLHPDNPGGGSSVFDQAEPLRLYDPHRAREIKLSGNARSWKEFLNSTYTHLEKLQANRGAGLRFLVEPTASPLLTSLRTRVVERFPEAKFYSYAPVSEAAARQGTRTAFGQAMEVDYDLTKAKVVLSLDSDFLCSAPGNLKRTHAFSSGRNPGPEMNRLYAVESSFTVTGAFADHRLRAKPSELPRIASALASALASAPGGESLRGLGLGAPEALGLSEAQRRWISAVAKDLAANRGRSAVLVGPRQPAAVQALGHALNAALGNVGQAVVLRRAFVPDAPGVLEGVESLSALAAELGQGRVDTLIITAFNPVYASPSDLKLGELIAKVPNTVYWGLHEDETAAHSGWFVPAAHFLETWGDAVATDGTVSVAQPLIKPLFGGVAEADVLAACLGEAEVGTYGQLKALWRQRSGNPVDFESRWEAWLAEGRIANTAVAPEGAPAARFAEVGQALQREVLTAAPPAQGAVELNLVPDYRVYDGRFANNAWMQELPDPISKITWDNVAYLSETTAARFGLASGDVISISARGQKVEAPVWILPGHADD
ncbi:MAG TPA: TAT-variant-translocated molybdopterin oxidoreductase, partial [Myxococcaceae bacterium]|nr:TAT-variant-translocated molybdopterin oxidoreductase [Myxococcaceae bacterium]